MKDNTIYNRPDNQVLVKSIDGKLYIVCHKEEQMQNVVERMSTDSCKLVEYEEWDGQFLMTFEIDDEGKIIYD
jgi:hypothetical protein